jgi:hypothetical protein
MTVVTALHGLVVAASWNYSVAHYGWWRAMCAVLVSSLGPLVALWFLFRSSLRRPTFWRSLLFHAAVVAWLVVLAFPDIVELP